MRFIMEDNNKNNKKGNKQGVSLNKSLVLRGAIAVLLLVATFFGGYYTHYFSLSKELRSIDFLLDVYKNHYFEESENDLVHLIADALLDQYSGYYTAEEYENYMAQGQGSKSGYGIALSQLKIVAVAGNSPAETVGIKQGGVIKGYKKVTDGEFTVATTQSKFTEFLQNTSDEVVLQIEYGDGIKEFALKSAAYLENYVYYSDSTGNYRFNGDESKMEMVKYEGENITLGIEWGYLKFTSFNGLKNGTLGGAGQFKKALDTFSANQKKKLIVDLRGNGGGYMSILCQIASYLCDDNGGKTFIAQKASYRNGKVDSFNAPISSYDKYNFESIVFLADVNSASASEALMGAVLDYDENSGNDIVKVVVEPIVENGATVYRTYGKGIMQSMFTNSKTGEAVKLTTAKVIWPISGTCIHGVGITPDLDERVFANLSSDAIAFAQTL